MKLPVFKNPPPKPSDEELEFDGLLTVVDDNGDLSYYNIKKQSWDLYASYTEAVDVNT